VGLKSRNKFALFMLLFGATACQSVQPSAALQPLALGSKYVAIGSSFAAGPGVGSKDPNAHPNCGQSTSNYPKLLARELSLYLVDVTCGGATTNNVLTSSQHTGLLPQIENITRDTALVTVTIGGNDLYLARDLSITSCINYSHSAQAPGMLCNSRPLPPPEEAFQALDGNLDRIAKEAKRRAPNARIVFLDYQAILPEGGTCEAIYLTNDELASLRARQLRYADIVRRVAARNNVEFFSAYQATLGHDACAAEPFMAGAISIGNGAWNVPNFHTNQGGMNAISQGLANYLRQRTDGK